MCILLFVTLGYVFIVFWSTLSSVGRPRVTNNILQFENGDSIYVHCYVWGLTSDHTRIVLSEKPIISKGYSEKSNYHDYIFYESCITYSISGDTLNVYTNHDKSKLLRLNRDQKFKRIKVIFQNTSQKNDSKNRGLEEMCI